KQTQRECGKVGVGGTGQPERGRQYRLRPDAEHGRQKDECGANEGLALPRSRHGSLRCLPARSCHVLLACSPRLSVTSAAYHLATRYRASIHALFTATCPSSIFNQG